MKIIGLTGSIGMGKSTCADQLRQMGVAVHDADACVHALLSTGGAAFDAVKTVFPSCVQSGAISRKKLGEIVFNDATKRAVLEAILHPLVHADQAKFIRDQRRKGANICVLDIPLLYETGAQARVDAVIVVTASASIQKRRVMARAGMTLAKFDAIKQSQIPDMQKRKLADYVVNTSRGMRFTAAALQKIVHELTV